MPTTTQAQDVSAVAALVNDPELNAIGFVFALDPVRKPAADHESMSVWCLATASYCATPGPEWALAATILVKKNGDVSSFVAPPWHRVEWLGDVVEMLTIEEGRTRRHTGPF